MKLKSVCDYLRANPLEVTTMKISDLTDDELSLPNNALDGIKQRDIKRFLEDKMRKTDDAITYSFSFYTAEEKAIETSIEAGALQTLTSGPAGIFTLITASTFDL